MRVQLSNMTVAIFKIFKIRAQTLNMTATLKPRMHEVNQNNRNPRALKNIKYSFNILQYPSFDI